MTDQESDKLTHTALQQLLDRHGSHRESWPAPEAQAAARLLAESLPARRELEAARALDGWLGQLREHRAPAGLAAAIAARVTQADRSDRLDRLDRPDRLEQCFDWLTARVWRPLLVGTLPVIAGFAIGYALPEQTDTDLTQQIGALAFVDIYQELTDAERP